MRKLIGSALIVGGLTTIAYSLNKQANDLADQRKREMEIKTNLVLDYIASARANRYVQQRIDSGELQWMAEINNAFDEQYEFERIALRA